MRGERAQISNADARVIFECGLVGLGEGQRGRFLSAKVENEDEDEEEDEKYNTSNVEYWTLNPDSESGLRRLSWLGIYR